MRVNGVLSYDLLSSTSSPKGCILSSLSFVLYTYECQSCYHGRHINKFVNDFVIVSLFTDDDLDHGPVVDNYYYY